MRYWLKVLLCSLFTLSTTANMLKAQDDMPQVWLDGVPGNDYSYGMMRVDDGTDKASEFRVKLKIRGATSRRYEKKSLVIKIVDEDGGKLDVDLLGMRSDNSWILDAMAVDKARMRNRVAFDLWNDFSAHSYIYESYDLRTRNGIDGRFVELWINGEYNGIYCLNERLDRKQLRLKKFEDGARGLLFKSEGFRGTDYWNYDEEYDNSSAVWMSWQCQYPDVEDDGPSDWFPLIDNIRFVRWADKATFNYEVAERFDLPVVMDYIIFYQFIYAQDNYSKNQFAYFYNIKKDKRQGLAPWDLDASFGRGWDGTPLDPCDEMACNYLYYRLLEDCTDFKNSLKQRYAHLRQTYFESSSLKHRFSTYFDLFRNCGAMQRECDRWSGVNGIHLDFDEEEKYIRLWIDERIAFMDKLWEYDGSPSSVVPFGDDSACTFVFSLDGQRVPVAKARKQRGVYIAKGRKVLL